MTPTEVTVPASDAVCVWSSEPRVSWAFGATVVDGAAPWAPKRRTAPPPVAGVVDGVTVACWPALILPIWVSSTLRSTTKEPVLMSWTWGLDDELDDELAELGARGAARLVSRHARRGRVHRRLRLGDLALEGSGVDGREHGAGGDLLAGLHVDGRDLARSREVQVLGVGGLEGARRRNRLTHG